MLLKKILLAIGFLLLSIANLHATTIAEECQKRSMSAYDTGASDSDKQRLGAAAAADCFKEMEDSLKKNGSSSSSSSVVGPAILLLVIGGFLAYKLATKGDKPLTPREIGARREQVRELYRSDSSDLTSVKKFKETRLEDAEKMFSMALAGDLPITGNTEKDGISTSRQELENFKVLARNRIDATQNALSADIRVRDSINKLFTEPPIDANDKEEMELRESLKVRLAATIKNIEKYQKELAELRG